MAIMDDFDNVRVQETNATIGLTIRDLVLEVRTNVMNLQKELTEFKSQVVMKSEWNAHKEAQKTARKYLFTTILSTISVGIAVLVAVVNLYPLP